MSLSDPRIGGLLSARNIVVGAVLIFPIYLLFFPTTPAQAALTGFIAGAALWLWLISRHQLDSVRLTRSHLPRVFEGTNVPVTLTVSRGSGLPVRMLEVRDQFLASLEVSQRHLIPILAEGWEVLLHYERLAERHRGLYLLGPVRLRTADPLGVFFEERDVECITTLTVYPQADPLPDYIIPGPAAASGPSMDVLARMGQGEEILGVREYVHGDPPLRVHWRTSARRGNLHVIQLNRSIQAELAVMLDLSRRARFGLGAESTIEQAIRAAVCILTRAHDACHRFSLTYTHEEPVIFPAGTGMAHLHLLLDRLAILSPAGETDFWPTCGARALMLQPGSRAAFIAAAYNTSLNETVDLVKRLIHIGIGVDLVMLDERDFIKIYKDQEYDARKNPISFEEKIDTLRQAGARVFPLRRGQASIADAMREQETS